MKDKIYDAVIIGAGPAGASLAYFLSDIELKIALVEKKKYADTPVRCAELVPKAFTMLYKDGIKGINNEISQMETYIEGKLANVTDSGGYILDRNIFVESLIKEFKKKGGDYFNSSSFTDAFYEETNEGFSGRQESIGQFINFNSKLHDDNYSQKLFVKIKDKDKTTFLKTKILVGADGPFSLVARIMQTLSRENFKLHKNNIKENIFLSGVRGNIDDKNSFQSAIREVHGKENNFLAGFQENINKVNKCKNNTKIFFYPFIAGGYGWIFPKLNSLNVGIAVNLNTLKQDSLKNIYLRFKNELSKDAIINGDEHMNSSVTGLAPVYGIRSRIVKNNIVLIGDAAGLCNPITGAGNYNAVLSAKIVSGKIKYALQAQNLEILNEAESEVCKYLKTSIDHALKKRQTLEEHNADYIFEDLIKKTWVSFKDYWRER